MSINTQDGYGLKAALVAASLAASMNASTPAIPPPKPRFATRYEQQQDKKRRIRDNNKLRAERLDPAKNVSTIEAARAKRELRTDRNRKNFAKMKATCYRGEWQPKPAHNKPTYKEIRAAQAGGA